MYDYIVSYVFIGAPPEINFRIRHWATTTNGRRLYVIQPITCMLNTFDLTIILSATFLCIF